MATMNTVPNLDAMHQAELWAFWTRYARPKRVEAEALIGDRRPGFTTLCGALAGYASNKATAMSCRERGDIQAATVYESICDSIYQKLPEDIRWNRGVAMSRPARDLLRHIILSPYAKGKGPRWSLRMWRSAYDAQHGREVVAYELRKVGERAPLFAGEDYSPSPLIAADSDASVAGLLGFLTLRPGDTDPEYFAKYTPAQRSFCVDHAEALALESVRRFGEH